MGDLFIHIFYLKIWKDKYFFGNSHFSPELRHARWEEVLAKVGSGVEEQVLRVLHDVDDDFDEGDGDDGVT